MKTFDECINIILNRINTMIKFAMVVDPDDVTCAYRSPNGSCFIGVLIDDKHYHPSFDKNGGFPAFDPAIQTALEKSGVPSSIRDIASDIQNIHDKHRLEDSLTDEIRLQMRQDLMKIVNEHKPEA